MIKTNGWKKMMKLIECKEPVLRNIKRIIHLYGYCVFQVYIDVTYLFLLYCLNNNNKHVPQNNFLTVF